MTDILDIKKQKVEVLLLQHIGESYPLVSVFKRTAANGDTWYVFPGGKFAEQDNPDETLAEGALRECEEELGIRPSLLAVFNDTLRHPKTPTTLTTYVLAKCEAGQEPKNCDPEENGELLFLAPLVASHLIGNRAPAEIHEYLSQIAVPKHA